MRANLKVLLLVFACEWITIIVNAQKLPVTQNASIRAPSNIKIDGQLSEWGGLLQALNPIDKLSYTISNDDENLYLTLVAPYKEACKKVLRGGLTFTVSQRTDKRRKDDPSNKAITFPIAKNQQYLGLFENFEEYSGYTDKTGKGKRKRDSLFKLTNQKAAAFFKTVEINDKIVPLTSIQGVMGSVQFNKNMDLVYELSIPLKYLGLNITYTESFSYNVCLNGESMEMRDMERKANPSIPAPTPPPGYIPPSPDVALAPTDFWGEYTLAKK